MEPSNRPRGIIGSLLNCYINEMAIYHTGGVFSYLPHYLDLALEDSVGHNPCMSVLARRRAIMGWLVS